MLTLAVTGDVNHYPLFSSHRHFQSEINSGFLFSAQGWIQSEGETCGIFHMGGSGVGEGGLEVNYQSFNRVF